MPAQAPLVIPFGEKWSKGIDQLGNALANYRDRQRQAESDQVNRKYIGTQTDMMQQKVDEANRDLAEDNELRLIREQARAAGKDPDRVALAWLADRNPKKAETYKDAIKSSALLMLQSGADPSQVIDYYNGKTGDKFRFVGMKGDWMEVADGRGTRHMFNWRTGESKQVGEGKPKTVQELEGEAAEKHPDGIMGFEAEKAGKIAKAQQGASGRKIDRWVDLGNRVRIYYLDGTTEEAEKGTSPNTILNVDSRNDQRDFRNETAMRKEFLQLPEVKTHSEIYGQLGRAQSAYHASLKPGTNLVAIDQTLITVLNKMLDPTSVVRESEYARTPQNMAALNRIKGKMQNIMQGGANLADEDRKALVQMIDQFYKISKTKFDVKRKYYSNLATRYGYSPENIVQPEWGVEGQGNSPAPNTTPAPSGLPEKSSAASQPERNQMQALPPATAHKGRIIRDTATGERYQSDGVRWNKIK